MTARPSPSPNTVGAAADGMARPRDDPPRHAGAPIRVAALFVAKGGCYFDLPGVEPWDRDRDARTYAGPWSVVAHSPCERWGRYWGGAPLTWPRLAKGDDEGCFAAALNAVRRWGGILEHPEGSAAWEEFGLVKPPHTGGWVAADAIQGFCGWTCCVEQGHYGHAARKKTWLYAHGVDLPSLIWGPSPATARLDEGFHSAEERRRAIRTGVCQRLSKRQRAATPLPVPRSASVDSCHGDDLGEAPIPISRFIG